MLDHWNWCCTGDTRFGRNVFDHWSRRCKTDNRCGGVTRSITGIKVKWASAGTGATYLITGAGVAKKTVQVPHVRSLEQKQKSRR